MLKKAISIFTIACMLSSSLAFNVFAQNSSTNQSSKRFDTAQSINSNNPRKSGQLIIKYKNNASLKSNRRSIINIGGKVLKSTKNGLALVEFPEDKISEKIGFLGKNNGVEYVVPNYIRNVTEFTKDLPNDPDYKKQWGLQSVNAPEAWTTIGNTDSLTEIKVAVIDTGLDMKHEDLKDRVTAGYDFVDMDEDPSPGPVNEEHATHVAGIIAASTDNGIGVAGTAGKAPVKIMPLRVLEAGSGDDFTIAQAIIYAADNGAKVINMSLGGNGESPALTEACNYAFSRNVVVVAAAGNSAIDARNYSPACIPGVISVTATDSDNSLAYFSNFGSIVELAAPGVDVLSTLPGNKYEAYSGTSMAAPFVASACALLLSKRPSLSLIEVEQYLTDSAKDLGDSGKDESFGYGLLDLNKALNTTSISPRLEIINVSNNSTIFDLVNIQTRFTYPENIVNTDLYVDNTVVQSVYNGPAAISDVELDTESDIESDTESVVKSVYSNKMFTNFELDTYKFKDGLHVLKVVAEDKENQSYSKEIKVNIRNTVYTGLRINLKHEDTPVKEGYIEVWNKYIQDGQTYYDYIYSGQTNKNGIAVIPGSVAPNGNNYVIAASYEFENGDELSQATVLEEATAPGIIEMNCDNLVPVTIDTGLTCSNQIVLANCIFPDSEQGFSFALSQTDSDGSFDTYMNPGTYSFDAIGNSLEVNEETGDISEQGPIYMLHTEETEIDSGNFLVTMDSNIDSLSKLNLAYQNIHGFLPQDTIYSINRDNSMLSFGFYLNDIANIPEVYITPGNCSYTLDITGQKDYQKAYIAIGGNVSDLEEGTETTVNIGDTFTGNIKLDKTRFVPGEEVYINSSLTDSYGNSLLYMDYIYDDVFSDLKGKNIVSYKTGANKVEFKSSDAAIKALEEPEEPVIPEEPVEVEYKSPATLCLIDSNNNVIKTEEQFSVDYLYTMLPQSLKTDKYKLKLIIDLPYLIQAETSLNVSRTIKNNAVKFTIELPDKTKATSATVEVIDTEYGNSYYSYGEDLLDGEMFVAVPKGKYKFIVNAITYKEIDPTDTPASTEIAEPTTTPAPTETIEPTPSTEPTVEEPIKVVDKSILYIMDGKSPANYSLSSSQLQKIKLSAKDENGEEIDNPAMYYLSIPLSTKRVFTEYIGAFDKINPMFDLYISKGTYNFGTEVYDKNGSLPERIIFKPSVQIGSKPLKTQTVEFTSDNLTEASLDSKSDKKYLYLAVSDPNTGFNGWLYLLKGKSVKVSKGTYDVDYLSENTQYGNTYVYSLNSRKDFTSDNTVLNCGNDFSISIKPNKSIYKVGETLKTTNIISDRYGNRLTDMYSYDLFNYFSSKLNSSKGSVILRKDQEKVKLYDIKAKEYIEVPYYDPRAPFMYIKDSFGDVIHTAKSTNFYTNSQIKLDPEWAISGNYKLVLTVDIDANGNKSGETSFKIK